MCKMRIFTHRTLSDSTSMDCDLRPGILCLESLKICVGPRTISNGAGDSGAFDERLGGKAGATIFGHDLVDRCERRLPSLTRQLRANDVPSEERGHRRGRVAIRQASIGRDRSFQREPLSIAVARAPVVLN